MPSRLTLGADAPKVRDLHEHPREHIRLAGPPPACIEPQGLQQRLLQLVYFLGFLQVHAVCRNKHSAVREEELGETVRGPIPTGPALWPPEAPQSDPSALCL